MTASLEKFYELAPMEVVPSHLRDDFAAFIATRDRVLRRLAPMPDTPKEVDYIVRRLFVHAREWVQEASGKKALQLKQARLMVQQVLDRGLFAANCEESERSIIASIQLRLQHDELPSVAQMEQLVKYYNRPGPVSFAGHRNNRK